MDSSTVNISFNKNLLKKIDKVAREESRSRSELIREAARMYIERKSRWRDIFLYGEEVSSGKNLSAGDVVAEVKKYRKESS